MFHLSTAASGWSATNVARSAYSFCERIGADNRLLSDGTYCYAHDSEGNRTARFIDANADGILDARDTDVTEYTWDNRNRLVEVTNRATAGGSATQVVDYLYDVENRWIGENIDSKADGAVDYQTRFVYDGNQIVLQFEKDSGGDFTAADLSNRCLWQPNAVDQFMADERPRLDANGNLATDEVLWPLTDHEGTVRDLSRFDGSTTSVVDHIIYDSFGKVVSESNPAEGSLFKFTGRATDNATGIEFHDQRVKIAGSPDWMSEDPSGFTAGDANTRRYCYNSPANLTDPTGLFPYVPYGGWSPQRPLPPPLGARLPITSSNVTISTNKGAWTGVARAFGQCPSGEFGQPGPPCSGGAYVSLGPGAMSSDVWVTDPDTCNSVAGPFGNNGGAMRLYVNLPPGTYNVTVLLEVTAKVSGSGRARAVGRFDTYANGFVSTNPPVSVDINKPPTWTGPSAFAHDAKVVTIPVTVPASGTALVVDYEPTLKATSNAALRVEVSALMKVVQIVPVAPRPLPTPKPPGEG